MTQDAADFRFSIFDFRFQNPKSKIQNSLFATGLLLMGLVGAAGCEKLMGAGSSTSKAAPVTEPPPIMPSRPVVPPTKILAKVNGKIISMRDVEIALQDRKVGMRALGGTWQPLTTEQLQGLLDELIMAEVLSQDSVARGLDRKTDVQTRFWYRFRNFFSQEWLTAQQDTLKQEVSEEEVAKFYEANKAVVFREPERIRARQLTVDSEDKAKAALVKLLEGVEFVSVAQQMSSHPEAAQGPMVDQQWIVRGAAITAAREENNVRRLDPVLEQAAFAIDKPGGVSSYVKGMDNHFHIFQLVERQPSRQKPLTEVADVIRNYLELQKLSEKSKALRNKAKVESFPDRLTGVEQP